MASYKNKFTDLGGDFNIRVLSDDFIHKDLETLKIKGKTGQSGNFAFKGKSNWKDNKFSSDTELKVDFPLTSKYFLWYGIRKGGEVKIHLDAGNTRVQNKDVNLFANVKSTNAEKTRFNIRLGANYWGQKCESNTRLELDSGNLQNVGLTHRNLVRHGKYLFGFVASLGLTDFTVRRTDAVIGHECDQTDLYVSHVAGEKPNGVLGKVVLDAVYKHNKNNSFALQASEDFTTEALSVTAGHRAQLNDDFTLKYKLDNKLKVAASLKYKVNNLFTFTTSALLDLRANPQFDSKAVLPIPLGFQLEFSV